MHTADLQNRVEGQRDNGQLQANQCARRKRGQEQEAEKTYLCSHSLAFVDQEATTPQKVQRKLPASCHAHWCGLGTVPLHIMLTKLTGVVHFPLTITLVG